MYDGAYDHTQHNIDIGWFIGIDESEQWDYFNHPFYFDEKGDLIYDCFMSHWHEWFEMEVRDAYRKCLDSYQEGNQHQHKRFIIQMLLYNTLKPPKRLTVKQQDVC